MNRFEALLAPPSLSPKELSIHIRMHPEIRSEVQVACKSELVSVSTRLHDELTTLRFRLPLGDGPADPRYQRVNVALTGSRATPIEWRFFAGEFAGLVDEHPRTVGPKTIMKTVQGLQDPWRVQAWAAQALRIACSAETEDPGHAASAWGSAARLYTAFFERCDVTESYTYGFQTDPAAQKACRTAWDGFLAGEVSALAQRADQYSRGQNAEAMAAALAALSTPEVTGLNPEAARHATATAQHAMVSGIRSASSLRAALEMYRIATVSDTRDRALLAAMATEARKLAKGFGDVDLIVECADLLGLRRVDDDTSGSLMRAARAEFYEAALAFAREAVSDAASVQDKKHASRVLAYLPPEREAGRTATGSVTVSQLLAALRGGAFEEERHRLEAILKKLMDAPGDSAAEDRALDQMIAFVEGHKDFVAIPEVAEAVHGAFGVIFSGAALRSLAGDSVRAHRMMDKITRALPEDQLVEIAGTKHSATEWSDLLRGSGARALPVRGQFLALRQGLNRAPVASREEANAVSDIIGFARANELEPEDEAWLSKTLGIVFSNAAGHHLDHSASSCSCIPIMRQIVSFLPSDTRLDLGGQNATLTEHLHLVQFASVLKRIQTAPLGSSAERSAVAQLIELLEEAGEVRIRGKSSREIGQAALQSTAVNNLQSPQGNSETVREALAYLARAGSDGAPGPAAVAKGRVAKSMKRTSGGNAVGRFFGALGLGVLQWIILVGLPLGWVWLARWLFQLLTGIVWAQVIVIAVAIVIPLGALGLWFIARQVESH